jgi:NitT/TauT family transport system substrate-binding protein
MIPRSALDHLRASLFAGLGIAVFAAPLPGRAQTPAPALEHVRLLLDWSWLPYHAAFFIAQDKGYFRDAGVEVAFEEGRGSNTTAILVGQGAFDMGHLNVTNAASAIAKGVPMRAVAVYQHRSGASFVGFKGKVHFDGVQSLKGLRIGSTPGGSDGLSLQVFSHANKIPLESLNIISLDSNGKNSALLTGSVDVVSGDSPAYISLVRAAGKEPEVMQLSDFGLPLLGFGFAANLNFIKAHPKAVAGVIAAARRGIADMDADIPAACTLIRARVQVSGTQAQCIDYITGMLPLTTPPSDASWGHSSPAEWEALVATLKDAGEIKSGKPVADYYTNDFVK